MDKVLCPKCQGEMEEGFRPDFMYGGAMPEQWVPGPPKKSLWFKLQVDKQILRQVKTFCCTKCGYLESYANK